MTTAKDLMSSTWSHEAFAMANQATVLSGNKLEQLVVRLQRHSGRSKEACWRFIIQHELKSKTEYHRWSQAEFETVREELVKKSVDEVAQKIKAKSEGNPKHVAKESSQPAGNPMRSLFDRGPGHSASCSQD